MIESMIKCCYAFAGFLKVKKIKCWVLKRNGDGGTMLVHGGCGVCLYREDGSGGKVVVVVVES